MAVIHENWDVNCDFSVRDAKDFVKVGIEVEQASGVIETPHHGLKGIVLSELPNAVI
jgi:hypothetical protein